MYTILTYYLAKFGGIVNYNTVTNTVSSWFDISKIDWFTFHSFVTKSRSVHSFVYSNTPFFVSKTVADGFCVHIVCRFLNFFVRQNRIK